MIPVSTLQVGQKPRPQSVRHLLEVLFPEPEIIDGHVFVKILDAGRRCIKVNCVVHNWCMNFVPVIDCVLDNHVSRVAR